VCDAAAEKAEYRLDATYGFVVIQGDHHTLALGTLNSFEVKFDKEFGVANKHGRGGQSQNRFARLAEESRLAHLKTVYERMERAFLAEDRSSLVERIVVGGPGPMKTQCVEHLPRVFSSLVEPQLVTTTAVGASGLQQVVVHLKEQCSSSSGAESQRQRQRERKEEVSECGGRFSGNETHLHRFLKW